MTTIDQIKDLRTHLLGVNQALNPRQLERYENSVDQLTSSLERLNRRAGKDAPKAIRAAIEEFHRAERAGLGLSVAIEAASDKTKELSSEFEKNAGFSNKVAKTWNNAAATVFALGNALKFPVSGLDLLGKTFTEVDKITLDYQNSVFLTGQTIKASSSDFKTGTDAIKYYKSAVEDLAKASKLGLPASEALMKAAIKGYVGLKDTSALNTIKNTAKAVAELGLTSEESMKKIQELQEVSNKFAEFRGEGIAKVENQARAIALQAAGIISVGQLQNTAVLGREMSQTKAFGAQGLQGEEARIEASRIQERNASLETTKLSNSLNIAMSEVHKRFLDLEISASNLSRSFVESHSELTAAGIALSRGGMIGGAIGIAGTLGASTYAGLKALKMTGGSMGGGAATGAAGGIGGRAIGGTVAGVGLAATSGLAIGLAANYAIKEYTKSIEEKTKQTVKSTILLKKEVEEIRKKRIEQDRQRMGLSGIAGFTGNSSTTTGNVSTKGMGEKELKETLDMITQISYSIGEITIKYESMVQLGKSYQSTFQGVGKLAEDFYMDAEMAVNALRLQNKFIDDQKESSIKIVEGYDKGIQSLNERIKLSETAEQKASLEAAKQELLNSKAVVGARIWTMETEKRKNALESSTKAVDVQLKIQGQNVSMAESLLNLHKEMQMGIGVNIQDQVTSAKASFDFAEKQLEKVKELKKHMKGLGNSPADLQQRKQIEFQIANAQIEATNAQTQAYSKLKGMREGYLDAMEESVVGGGGALELLPSQTSGVQMFAPTPGLGVQYGSSGAAQNAAFQGEPIKMTPFGLSGNLGGYEKALSGAYSSKEMGEYGRKNLDAMNGNLENLTAFIKTTTAEQNILADYAQSGGIPVKINGMIGKKDGGVVHGPSGVDKVPAMLTAGEYIATTEQAPFVKAMLEGNVRGYAEGGPVGGVDGRGGFDAALSRIRKPRIVEGTIGSMPNLLQSYIKRNKSSFENPGIRSHIDRKIKLDRLKEPASRLFSLSSSSLNLSDPSDFLENFKRKEKFYENWGFYPMEISKVSKGSETGPNPNEAFNIFDSFHKGGITKGGVINTVPGELVVPPAAAQNLISHYEKPSSKGGGDMSGTIEIVLSVDGKRSSQFITLDQLKTKGAKVTHSVVGI